MIFPFADSDGFAAKVLTTLSVDWNVVLQEINQQFDNPAEDDTEEIPSSLLFRDFFCERVHSVSLRLSHPTILPSRQHKKPFTATSA